MHASSDIIAEKRLMWGECVQMQHKSQRRPVVGLFFALVGILFTACSGPSLGDNVNAAVINNSDISMSKFLTITRLIEAVTNINDTSLPSWQLPRGRTSHEASQKQALNLLTTDALLDQQAKKLLTPTAWANVRTQEDAQLKSLFSQVPSQYQPLVDQKLLTPDTYRPFIHQQIIEQSLIDPKNVNGGVLKANVAHVKVLTVRTKQQAATLLAQLQKGGDWAKLATANSIDTAQASGGDIAVLPPGYLPPEVDSAVFGTKSAKPIALNTIYMTQKPSHLGYSLVEVLSRTEGVSIATLSSTQPIVTNAQISPQGAAINGLITQWARDAKLNVNVNWCGDVGGVACPTVLTLDQQS
jgi:hypothetical protein